MTTRRWIRRLLKYLRWSWREARLWIRYELALRSVESRNPIFVYQMGKVGSSTVVRTIKGLDVRRPVYHIHSLSEERLERAVRRQRESARPFLPEHLIVSRILVRKLRRGVFPCNIITLTREPVSRAVSFVFQDLVKQVPNARKSARSIDVGTVTSALDSLLAGSNGNADPTLWFDAELRACFGVDVFSKPYDFDRGFTIFRDGSAPVLLIRMEDLDRSLPIALRTFLDVDQTAIKPRKANVGAAKWYSSELREVKKRYRPSEKAAEKVYGSRYFRHFYGVDQVNGPMQALSPESTTQG